MIVNDFFIKDNIIEFKDNFLESKKYWIISLILILIFFFSIMDTKNYAHPKMEIALLIISSIISVFLITFYQGHRDNQNFYKTVFVVIFIFGIIFSVLTPIMCTHDEVEHFARAEITSQGIINPEYIEIPFDLDGRENSGYYLTIQSTLDLAEKGKSEMSYIAMDMEKSSIFNTDADTQPINYTPVKFHGAFTQNPFYGYIVPAMGMLIAKLLDLNAIWLLWLGRIFNALLYATLVTYAIKKTPILKMPLFVIACIPAALSQASSISIDALINGLAILSISYFLIYYKSPKNSLDFKPIIKFFIIVLLLSLCKVTYACFIFLLLFIPKDNFKEKKYYYCIGLLIILLIGILALWSKFWVNPAVFHSWRSRHMYNAVDQLNYILTHKKDTITLIFHLFGDNLNNVLKCTSYFTTNDSSLFLMFMGAIYLLYPHERIDPKTKIGTLIVFFMLYIGTYVVFLLTWHPFKDGVQSRYFLPALGLIPIFLGINHMEGDTTEMDNYIVMLTIVFIVFRILTMTIIAY